MLQLAHSKSRGACPMLGAHVSAENALSGHLGYSQGA